MPNDLPATRLEGSIISLHAEAWFDLIARLTLTEARLAAHHHDRYDVDCAACKQVQPL